MILIYAPIRARSTGRAAQPLKGILEAVKVETRHIEIIRGSTLSLCRVHFTVALDIGVMVEAQHSFDISFDVGGSGLDDAVTQARADLELFAQQLGDAARQSATP